CSEPPNANVALSKPRQTANLKQLLRAAAAGASGARVQQSAYWPIFSARTYRSPAQPLSLFAPEEAAMHSATIFAVSAAPRFIASAIVLRNWLAWGWELSPIPIFQSPHVQSLRRRSMRG